MNTAHPQETTVKPLRHMPRNTACRRRLRRYLRQHRLRPRLMREWDPDKGLRRPDLAGHLQPLGRVGQIHAVQANVRNTASVEAAVRGRDLTRKLLAMGRQQDLSMKSVDLNVQLDDLLSLLRRVLPETINVDLIRGARLPLVDADGSQLDQVFMNLCINARDAMPSGGRLTLETEQVVVNGSYVASHPWARPGRYVLVTVTDTGTGISREVQERIFEPFFTTKEAG